jgi:predicted aspartyl protease
LHFPYLPFELTIAGRIVNLEGLVDTGFDGAIVVPEGLIPSMTQPDGHLIWQLADDSQVLAPAYTGRVRFGDLGSVPVVITVLGDEPIIGRQVTDLFLLTLDHGRQIILAR